MLTLKIKVVKRNKETRIYISMQSIISRFFNVVISGDPNDSQRARMRSSGGEFEPTSSGKKVAMKSASALFEFEPTEDGKKVIQPGTGKSFIEYVEPKYTKEELDDTREGDFFSFRDMKNLRELELPLDDRNSTPLFSPPDTPDSMPDSLAPTPTSKLFLSDAFMDIREEWLNVQQEQMIQITQVRNRYQH